ncbi:hypothetical protein ES703_47164 [subsurface metagenome]
MIHLHGEHDCYCPACGVTLTVGEAVQCFGIDCPDCGTRMRAVDIGERRVAPQEIIGYSAAELPTALDLVESTMEVGGKARLAICTEALPTEDELDDLYLGMLAGGFHAYRPTARVIDGIPTTELVLQKGSPSFAVIVPLLVPLFIIGLIAFGIVRIEAISKALLPLMIAGAVGVIGLALIVRKPAERIIAERYLPKA